MLAQTKPFSKKTIVNAIVALLFVIVLFVPAAKAMVIRGLLEIGLFNPSITPNAKAVKVGLADIKFKDAQGKIISLADCKGKVVFLNFWAIWCPPCLAEMPAINKFYEQFKKEDIIFIMVDADGNFAKSQAYMDRKIYQLPIYTLASDIPKSIFKGSLPTTVVFDKEGRISFQGEGAANYSSEKFTGFIEKLLK
jgi:thiol-disulfide isomerase/thioredoxin